LFLHLAIRTAFTAKSGSSGTSVRKAVLCPNGAEHASPGQSEAGVPANVAPGTPAPEHASPERAKQDSLGVCSALSGNAVKDFLTRKKACERIVAEFVRIRNARKSSEFSRIRLRKSFTALPFRALRICGFTTWGVARGSCRVAVPQADLFRPFGAMHESSRQSKGSSQNPVPRASAG
jgi:hypothetical protein